MKNDDYATCKETYVRLRVYHHSDAPSAVSEMLNLEPTSMQTAGGEGMRRGKPYTYKISGWFLESRDKVESYDSAMHLLWLMKMLDDKTVALDRLKSLGWWMDISCYWDSEAGHGGPTLDPELLSMLAKLKIKLWFDVYFSGAMDYTKIIKQACATLGDSRG